MADHAVDVERMKTAVEDMWRTTSSKRERRKVSSEAAPGFSLFGDNIGKGFHFFISLSRTHQCPDQDCLTRVLITLALI